MPQQFGDRGLNGVAYGDDHRVLVVAGLFQGLIAHAPVRLKLHIGVDTDFEVPLDQELETPIRHLQHA
jgi:hypothetical protein